MEQLKMNLTGRKKTWLLHQCQTAAFYQSECWAAFSEIESLISRDAGICRCDVLSTFFQVHSLFSGRDLYAADLVLFFEARHELRHEQNCLHLLKKKTRAGILNEMRKANWTYDQVLRLAKVIARAVKLNPEFVLEQISELACVTGR